MALEILHHGISRPWRQKYCTTKYLVHGISNISSIILHKEYCTAKYLVHGARNIAPRNISFMALEILHREISRPWHQQYFIDNIAPWNISSITFHEGYCTVEYFDDSITLSILHCEISYPWRQKYCTAEYYVGSLLHRGISRPRFCR